MNRQLVSFIILDLEGFKLTLLQTSFVLESALKPVHRVNPAFNVPWKQVQTFELLLSDCLSFKWVTYCNQGSSDTVSRSEVVLNNGLSRAKSIVEGSSLLIVGTCVVPVEVVNSLVSLLLGKYCWQAEKSH